MEPPKFDPETRKRPIPAASETTVHDVNPPRPLRAPSSPPERPWLMPALAVAVVLVMFSCMAIVYRAGVSHGSKDAAQAPPPASPSAAATRVLLQDPVCKRAVDPATAPAVLDFGGKSIYFDSLDCLNAFRADPVKYGAGRIRVHISEQTDRPSPAAASPDAASPAPEASASAAVVVPDAAPTPAHELPPEPTTQDNGPPAAATPPSGGTLDEDMPTPSKQSEEPPPAPDANPPAEPPAEPAPKPRPKASQPKTAQPKAAPKGAPSQPNMEAPPPEDGEFSLPPELKEGPPPRKPSGQ